MKVKINEKKLVKFNLYMSCVLLVAFVLMLVATTVAYFSDTQKMTNTFTSGNVQLMLSEAAVKPDANGNLIEDPNSTRIFGSDTNTVHNYGCVFPGQSIFKDPTIANTGDDDEWIAAKVTLTDGAGDLTRIMGYEGYEDIDIEILLSGGLLAENVHVGTWNGIEYVCHNDRYAMIQIPDPSNSKFEFYFLMLQPLKKGESVVLFDHISFPEKWSGEAMQNIADLKIEIQAYGVQTYQLDSCLAAMTKAFPTHFPFQQYVNKP